MRPKQLINFIILLLLSNLLFSQREIVVKKNKVDPNFQSIKIVGAPTCGYLNSLPVLTFNDEFNGNSLDLSKWKPQLPWGIANSDSSDTWCDPNEIAFTGNSVRFNVNKNFKGDVLIDGNIEGREYSTGTISSIQTFGYGYYQIRCKIPKIAELWPAFWMYGNCGQEIDIFEFNGSEYKSSEKKAFHDRLSTCTPHRPRWYMPQECASASPIMTFHAPTNTKAPCIGKITEARVVGRYLRYYSWGVKKTAFNFKKGCIYDNVNVDLDFHSDWHTFGLSYTQEGIVWFIDSIPQIVEHRYYKKQFNGTYVPACLFGYCFSNDTLNLYEQVNFPQPNILMAVILGNGHRKLPDYNLTKWIDEVKNWPEGALEVDYFRFYQYTGTDKNSIWCNTDLPVDWQSEFTIYPNPSDGNFIIKTNNDNEEKSYRLFDFMGKLIGSGAFDSQDFPVSLNLISGIYNLEVTSNGQTGYKRVAIQ